MVRASRGSLRKRCEHLEDQARQLEMRILCPDEVQRWTVVRCRLERDASGQSSRLIGAVQDITERKDAEDALQATQSELARLTQLSTMGQMAAAIAHEINQPLAAIVTNGNAALRWLTAATPNLEEGSAALKRVVSEGHRAASVIAGIRAMFKKDQQEKALVAINGLIGEVLLLSQGELKRTRVSVQTQLPNDLPDVLANRISAAASDLQPRQQFGGRNGFDARRRPRLAPDDREERRIRCGDLSGRHRSWARRRRAGPHLRTILHDQNPWDGDGTVDLPVDRRGAQRSPYRRIGRRARLRLSHNVALGYRRQFFDRS